MNFKAPLIKWNRFLLWFKSRTGEIGSVAIGIATFGALTNWKILNPLFVRWLYWGDPSSSYLGWQFFRKTRLLQFPLGLNPNYGTGFSSSIMFTDSVPLIAIPLKYLSFLLPYEFQYFGLWIFAAFVFQAWFAWKVLSHFVSHLGVLLFGVVLFTNTPVLIYRMVHDGAGHIGFIGQFLILWSISLYLDEAPTKKWLPILVVTPLIWMGFIPIIFALYISSITQRLYSQSKPLEYKIVAMLTSIAFGLTSMIATLWVTGGLQVSDFGDSGFGYYRSSLTSLFDPQIPGLFSFSQIIPNLNNLPGSQEGFAFLGVPSLFLIITSFVLFRKNNPLFHKKFFFLYFAVIGMGAFSLSNRVSILGRELFVYPIPREVLQLISPFRASGRFVWPLIYVLILFGLISLMTLMQNRKNFGFLVLVVLLSVQTFESVEIFHSVRQRFTEIKFTPQLVSPRWDQLAQNYDRLVVIPPLNNDPGWFELALLADKWGLSTNATYLARFDQWDFDMSKSKTQDDLEHFRFNLQTLYVITNYPPNSVTAELIELDKSDTIGGARVLSIDGFVVIAP